MSAQNGHREGGFGLVEAIVVIFLFIVLAAFTLPLFNRNNSYVSLRTSAFDIANRINEAKARAISEITPYRVNIPDLAATTFDVEKKLAGGGWQKVLSEDLSTRVNFTPASTPAPTSASSAGGSTQCSSRTGICAPVQATTITFNTRGIPVDAAGAPKAANAVYITNGTEFFAVTVSLSGVVEVWRYAAAENTWFRP